MFTSVEEITDKLAQIRQRGFIRTKRKGSTGVGHTLEVELGLSENNVIVPDLGEVELKATRSISSTPITLFTRDKDAWQVPQRDVISDFGISEGDRMNLYVTLAGSDPSRRLQIEVTESSVLLCDDRGRTIARWNFDELLTHFHQKVRHLILVSAQTHEQNGIEHFRYYKAMFYSGWMLRWHLPGLFENGVLKLDLRMHLTNNKVRNHGTGFRIAESDIDQLYPYGEELPIARHSDSATTT